eukprot:TRINITY_DN4094_c0_g1_i4.p1 TRINITY_DN4094_c0_g1~~TRINITY_DN4094_c0_g1_i4.p1  ORF type:complete len:149 (+),score=46.42 TRINITY_DN4094_c0_g1_i4:139-585(+)
MERKRGLTPKADSEDENSQSESEFECELVEAEECETIVELPKKKNSRKSSYQKIQEEANKKINKNGTNKKRKDYDEQVKQLIQETMIKQMREALRGSYDEDEDDEPAKKQSKARKQPQKFEVIKEEFLDEEPQLIDWDNRYMPYYGKR